MKTKVVYVLHKNGAKSHYLGLEHVFFNDESIHLKHREFSIASKMFKSITKVKPKLFQKQLLNLGFLIQLLFSKNKKIVLGIAPYDQKLGRLLFVLKKHKVYYHSSWTCWDKSFQPKKSKSAKIYKTWQNFLERKAKHIFAVSAQTKTSLLSNYTISTEKISVVNHCLHKAFLEEYETKRKENSFLYVGRLTPEKGIEEILKFFSKNEQLTLSIVGEGKLHETVTKAASENTNIKFLTKITNQTKLAQVFSAHQFLLLNSKKVPNWEELFGMVLIEAMSQGTIPIASNHSGPKEIITKETGYLFEEGKLKTAIFAVLSDGFSEEMSKNAIESAKKYSLEKIAKKWIPVLN